MEILKQVNGILDLEVFVSSAPQTFPLTELRLDQLYLSFLVLFLF